MLENISKVLFPWLELEKKKIEADEKKFREFLSILDPSDVRDFCNNLSTNYYTQNLNDAMDRYRRFTALPTTVFYRPKLKKSFLEFNKHSINLHDFLLRNFSRNGFDGEFLVMNRNDYYDKNLVQLEDLSESFYYQYTLLVKTGEEKYAGTLAALTSVLFLALVLISAFIGGLFSNK